MDANANGVLVTSAEAVGLDSSWRFVASGAYYNIDCKYTGRGCLDSNASSLVVWNSTEPEVAASDLQWEIVHVSGDVYRFRNAYSGRDYLYDTGASNQVKWNTGETDISTEWMLIPE